jgi:hypothetical protein
MKIQTIHILLSIVGVLLLAGCHKLEATTRIEPDGSGELQMGIGFSQEERANLEKQNPNQQDFCNTSQSSPGLTVLEEPRGDETWCINIMRFNDLDELRDLYGQQEGITINRLEISDGMFYYDIDVDLSSEDSGFSVLTEMTWSVVLPGASMAHNADQVDGNTLTWQPAPKSGIVNLRTESEAPQSGIPFPPCGAAFIWIGVGLTFLRRGGQEILR